MFIPRKEELCKNGTDICFSIPSQLGQDREDRLLESYLKNLDIPAFLTNFVPLEIKDESNILIIKVIPDYLSLGNNDNYIRTPLSPITAQKIANEWGCILPTKKIVDIIWKKSEIKLTPYPLPPTPKMITKEWFIKSNEAIERQLTLEKSFSVGKLIAGHKKDIIITNKTSIGAKNVTIYGWHMKNGIPIQNINAKSHDENYSDYSHGIRLIDEICILNGVSANIRDILNNKDLHKMISDDLIEYPTYRI